MRIAGDGTVGVNVTDPDAMLEIGTNATTEEGLHIKGSASQTASLMTMTDSADATFFSSGDGLAGSEVVWNEQGVDIDFRVEGDGNTNLIFAKASDDQVGINNDPDVTLDVNGILRVEGQNAPDYPTTGEGFEIAYDADGQAGSGSGGSGVTVFQSYSRDSSAWRDLWFRARSIEFDKQGSGGSIVFTADTTIQSGQPDLEVDWTNTAQFGRVLFQENGLNRGVFQQIGSTFATVDRRDNMEFFNAVTSGGGGAITFLTSGINERSRITRTGLTSINDTDPDAMLEIVTNATTEEGLHIKGSASQTGSLMTMTDSSDNIFFNSGDGLTSSEVVWNDQQVDINFRIEGDGVDDLFFTDAGNDRVGIIDQAPVSSLDVNGSLSLPTIAKTGAYTATESDHVILCDATSAAFTITLPAVAGIAGRIYHIKKTDSSANAVTVDGNGSETIDGSTTAVLASQYDSIMIITDATEWHII